MAYSTQKQYRLPSHNYAGSGWYFITICTNNRQQIFGNIVNQRMELSPVGMIANQYWRDITHHYGFISLDTFVIMPDHMHGILRIDGGRNHIGNDSRRNGRSTVPTMTVPKKRILQPQRNSISIAVREYKSAVTRWCRKKTVIHNVWQPRFHDRIIRTETELRRIRKYIVENPRNW